MVPARTQSDECKTRTQLGASVSNESGVECTAASILLGARCTENGLRERARLPALSTSCQGVLVRWVCEHTNHGSSIELSAQKKTTK